MSERDRLFTEIAIILRVDPEGVAATAFFARAYLASLRDTILREVLVH